MVKFLTDKEYDRFPEDMREAAREAYETFLHTRDGQLADIIVDRAALDAIKKAGERSKEEIVRQYAESTVAVADIRIAVRACKTGKSSDFMKKAMAECDTLDKERLIHAAVSGMDQIMGYLAETKYGDGALALAESASAFERWCDNQIMETIRPQLYNSFSLGPLVAYVLAVKMRSRRCGSFSPESAAAFRKSLSGKGQGKCMYKIAVLGDYNSIYGFAALGLDTFPVEDPAEGKEKLNRLAAGEYAVIYITEQLAAQLSAEISKYSEELMPAIIQIPGISGNTGAGIENVKKSVETAVGSDILFSNE